MEPNQQTTQESTPQPVQETPSPPPQPPAPPLQKPQRNNLLIAGLVATFLALAGTAGFFGYKYFQTQPSQPTPTPLSSAAPAKEGDPTANWKTYTNQDYKFTFKYPSEWQLNCNTPQPGNWLDSNICDLRAPNTTLDHGQLQNGAYLTIGVSKPNPNYSTLDEYVSYSVNQHNYKSIPKTFNNIPGYLLSPPENGSVYSNFVFESNGHFLSANWLPQDENDPRYTTIMQILSTFQFLDQNNNTSDWKTYTNNLWGYSVKYPADQLVACNPTDAEGLRLWTAPFDCPDGHDIFYEIGIIGNEPGEYQEYKPPITTQEISIGDTKATKKTYQYNDEDGPLQAAGGSTKILIPTAKGTIEIQLLGTDPQKIARFNLILSTFQFLD